MLYSLQGARILCEMLRVGYAMSGAEVGFAATSRYCDGSGRDGVHEGGGWKPWSVNS